MTVDPEENARARLVEPPVGGVEDIPDLGSAEQAVAAFLEHRAALRELTEPAFKSIEAQMARLKDTDTSLFLDKKRFELPSGTYSLDDFPESPDVQAVGVLHKVHEELQGMVGILNESHDQTAAMVRVTQANLVTVDALLVEFRQLRNSTDRSGRALFWLTVALFVAAAVAAIAVVPDFIKQVAQVVSWIGSHI